MKNAKARTMTAYSDARSLIARGKLSSARAIESFLDPVLVVASLVLVTQLFGIAFDKRYLLLAFVAFSANFPGRPFLADSRAGMVHKTLLDWVTFAGMLSLFGYASQYSRYFSQPALLAWLVATPVALAGARLTVRELLPRFFALKGQYRSAVILGCNASGTRLADSFRKYPWTGVKCLGFFDDRSRDRLEGIGSEPLLGNFAQVTRFMQVSRVEHIYLALPMASQPRILKILQELRDTTASIFFVPDIFVTDLIQGRIDHVGGVPVVAVCETPFIGVSRLIKRLFDVVLSSVLLLLLSPLLLLITLAVRLTSPGPVIFRQRRYGLDGEQIMVCKFRTMTVTEDGDRNYVQVTRNDSRVTAVGAVLRRLSLDELPQLFNVLHGTMSLVGPRPHAVAVNEQYRRLIPGYMVRHKVKPGITGWAQVHGYRGGDDLESMTKRIEYDLDYLRQWSVRLDVQIIWRTARLLLAGDGRAY
jgi:putative colanic acid biosynthesis UDP-glucose lipid carrier transferase